MHHHPYAITSMFTHTQCLLCREHNALHRLQLTCTAITIAILTPAKYFIGNVVCRLDDFHIMPVFISIAYGDAGLTDPIFESCVIASGFLIGVTSGKHYNCAICPLKLMHACRSCRQAFGSFAIQN